MLYHHYITMDKKEIRALLSCILTIYNGTCFTIKYAPNESREIELKCNSVISDYEMFIDDCLSESENYVVDMLNLYAIRISRTSERFHERSYVDIIDMLFEKDKETLYVLERSLEKDLKRKEPVKKQPEQDKSNTKNKEDEKMNTSKIFPDLKVGKITDDSVKMSHLGAAVRNKEGNFVAYDKSQKNLVNVNIASVDAGSFMFQLPAMVNDIKINDCILYNDTYYHVTGLNPLKGVNYYDGTEDVLQVTMSMFGFNFVTKVVSLMDMTNMAGGSSNNMNTMLPLILLDNNSDSDDTLKMLMLMQFMQPNGQQGMMTGNMMFNNPFIFLALAGDGKSDMSALLAMSMLSQMPQMNMNIQQQTPVTPSVDPGVGTANPV